MAAWRSSSKQSYIIYSGIFSLLHSLLGKLLNILIQKTFTEVAISICDSLIDFPSAALLTVTPGYFLRKVSASVNMKAKGLWIVWFYLINPTSIVVYTISKSDFAPPRSLKQFIADSRWRRWAVLLILKPNSLFLIISCKNTCKNLIFYRTVFFLQIQSDWLRRRLRKFGAIREASKQ